MTPGRYEDRVRRVTQARFGAMNADELLLSRKRRLAMQMYMPIRGKKLIAQDRPVSSVVYRRGILSSRRAGDIRLDSAFGGEEAPRAILLES